MQPQPGDGGHAGRNTQAPFNEYEQAAQMKMRLVQQQALEASDMANKSRMTRLKKKKVSPLSRP